MKIKNRKFIYLISPNKITPKFYENLNKVLLTGKVSFFQMRFKKYSLKKKIIIGKKIKIICKNNNVKFIVNDDPFLTKKLDADGCHLGQKDLDVIKARRIIGKKIIGVTCHNSIKLAKEALKLKSKLFSFWCILSNSNKESKI